MPGSFHNSSIELLCKYSAFLPGCIRPINDKFNLRSIWRSRLANRNRNSFFLQFTLQINRFAFRERVLLTIALQEVRLNEPSFHFICCGKGTREGSCSEICPNNSSQALPHFSFYPASPITNPRSPEPLRLSCKR